MMNDRIDVKILHYAYHNNKDGPVLTCKCRDKELKIHIVSIFDMENLAPRFGVLRDEGLKWLYSKEGITYRYSKGPPSLYGEETLRIYTTFPWQVPKIRDDFSWTFQADVKWEKMAIAEIIRICGLESPYINIPSDYPFKYLKVKDIKNVPEERRFKVLERISYWDIEIDGRQATSFDGYKDAGICPIISICCYDNYDEIYYQFVWHPSFKEDGVRYFKNHEIKQKEKSIIIDSIVRFESTNERKMINSFFKHFSDKKYDDELGYWSEGGYKKWGGSKKWNNGFDSPFLYERTKFLGMLDNMQKMSPFGTVYSRNNGGKYTVVIAGVGQIDWVFSNEVLQVEQKYYDFRGGRLADWMAYFTDFEKLDKRGKQPVYYWLNNLEFELDYNLIDVWGLVELDKKFDMSGKQRGRCDVVLSPLEDGIMASKLHDHAKLTIYQQDYAFDTKYYGGNKYREPLKGKKQIGEKFTLTLRDLEKAGKGAGEHYESLFDIHKVGGFVKDIQPGVYEDVAVIDFTKYYPNMFKSTNAGILPMIDLLEVGYWFCIRDTDGNIFDRKDIIETPVAYFRKDIKSLHSKIFDRWSGRRVIAQDKLKNYIKKYRTTKTEEYLRLWVEQFNLKNFTNAYFGIIGLPIDRGHNKLAFNACTTSCQDVIRMCLNKLIDMGYKIIGGDTDSLFLKLQSKGRINQIIEGKWICNVINIAVEEYMERVYNIKYFDNTIKIGLETVSDKMYVDGKKHYIKRNWYVNGQILEKPELEIKGMDLKKRSTSQIAADLQNKLSYCLFYEEDPLEAMSSYILELDESLEEKEWDYVCKRAPLQKRLDKYPDSNESATGARNATKYLGTDFKPGDNPFLGVFKKFPPRINGKFVENNGNNFKLSFYREDILKLKELGFKLNYDNIRSTQLFAKSEHILAIFGEDYDSIVESGETGDFMNP